MKSLRIGLAAMAGLWVACAGASANRINWTCTALAGEQYFQGYGSSRDRVSSDPFPWSYRR